MPELPEVEKVRLDIEESWDSRRSLERIQMFRKNLRFPLPSKSDCKSLLGKKPSGFRRIGKFLLFDFSTHHILSHLGMSGSWRWVDKDFTRRIHDHVYLDLSDGTRLAYHDPRRFGSFEILTSKELSARSTLVHMGPDPLNDDLNPKFFLERFRKRTTAIKVLLMDQRSIAGVGNIYACEALFRSGLHPMLPSGKLTLKDWSRLLKVLPQLLREAVQSGGTTFRDYVQASGAKGEFSAFLKVYGRSGQPCVRCGQMICSEVLAQRNTFWCPKCQTGARAT